MGWILSTRRVSGGKAEVNVNAGRWFQENKHTSASVLGVHLHITENRSVRVWGWCCASLGPGSHYFPCPNLTFFCTQSDVAPVGAIVSGEQPPAARAIIVIFHSICCDLLASTL